MDNSTTKPTTIPTLDTCISGITSPDGELSLYVNEEEISELNELTVNLALVTRNIAPRDENDEATAILSVQPLEYDTYCDSADEFWTCPGLGVTRFTTTLPTERERETHTVINLLRDGRTLDSVARNWGYKVSHNVDCDQIEANIVTLDPFFDVQAPPVK
ncbi:hypothetical protein FACUT_6821 [Fusarium acutatum]|uniref:Uncharacterized protein n=1 Tax=Fusarium acutatum TaxID=78861 RepID=A0A8H4NRF0_9HYPO|nr:hypothetical protein FACUT_6821 [Fusarium acutatum]